MSVQNLQDVTAYKNSFSTGSTFSTQQVAATPSVHANTNVPVLEIQQANSALRIAAYPSTRSWLKMAMDRAGALMALIALSPVFLVLSYLVKRDGGPAFYAQTRIGQHGQPFKCWKFRSMHINSKALLEQLLATDSAAREEYARDFKLKNDPRVTGIGAFLRSSSLDELPQLYNILCGEMSMVGPRPITEPELALYGSMKIDYLAIKPGMTGLWQVSGRNDVSYAQRVQLDSFYARNWNLLLDLSIIAKTVLVVVKRKGAY